MPELSEDQLMVIGKIIEFTLQGKGDSEDIDRLCGRLMELLPAKARHDVLRGMSVHRATLMLEQLRSLGYVT